MKPTKVDISDYNKVVEMFHDETDRAAAVLAGSFLENYLAKFLRAHMVDDKEVDQLFDGFGPFADYKKRVECAYAFKLITKEDRRQLNLIGKIRNHFAHHPHETTFINDPIVSWCKQLPQFDPSPPINQDPKRYKNRVIYLLAIGMLVTKWHNETIKMDLPVNEYPK